MSLLSFAELARASGVRPSRGHLKVCALNHINSDKLGTCSSNRLVAVAQLRFEMLCHSQSGVSLGGEAACDEPAG